MITLPPDEELSSDLAHTGPPVPSKQTDDLTQQEIDAGLRRLHEKLQSPRLPLIVLIEDESADADLFRQALRTAAVPVELMHFRDAAQAIQFFRGQGPFADREKYPLPDITVLNFKSPRNENLQILQLIRSDAQLEPLIVVALAEPGIDRNAHPSNSLSINDWIDTSLLQEDVERIVRKLL